MKTCATCKNGIALSKALDAGGFVGCKFLPVGSYQPGHQACRFSPVRWEAKST